MTGLLLIVVVGVIGLVVVRAYNLEGAKVWRAVADQRLTVRSSGPNDVVQWLEAETLFVRDAVLTENEKVPGRDEPQT